MNTIRRMEALEVLIESAISRVDEDDAATWLHQATDFSERAGLHEWADALDLVKELVDAYSRKVRLSELLEDLRGTIKMERAL